MGADLYLNRAYKKRLKKMQPKLNEAFQKHASLIQGTIHYQQSQEACLHLLNQLHEGVYYRDSYNNGSIAWSLNLSWWEDISPMLDTKKLLSIDKTYVLIETIKGKKPQISDDLLEHFDSKEEARKYLKEKKIELLQFLQKSINNDDAIYCSL